MIAPAIPLPVLLFLWHGPILWGTGYFPSHQAFEEVKAAILEDPMMMITHAECLMRPLPIDYSCQDPDHPPHYGRDGHNECSNNW